jgi:hypothetical protein
MALGFEHTVLQWFLGSGLLPLTQQDTARGWASIGSDM